MKQRIISGVIMGAIVTTVLLVGLNVNSVIITVFLAAVAAMATWELTFNALGIKWLPFQILPMAYTAGSVWLISNWLNGAMQNIFYYENASQNGIEMIQSEEVWDKFAENPAIVIMTISVVYFITMAILSLVKQAELDLTKIFSLCAMPLFLSFAFALLGSVITLENGVFLLLLIDTDFLEVY